MDAPPSDWLSLLVLTFVLGMRHGFDADHLATIDGLTRANLRHRPALARYCGTLFSLGHGAVVMLIALSVSLLAGRWHVPEWFGPVGAAISIGFLVLIGVLNLAAVVRAAPDEVVQPVGLKGRVLGKMHHVSHPALVAMVGALFALSFDTLSQAAFFALTATRFGGWGHAVLLALLFTAGMLLTDGINGLWIARLIARADQVARIASRVMALVVSAISLIVAAYGAARLFSPAIEAWGEGKELWIGITLVGFVLAGYVLAVRLPKRLPTA